MDNKVTNISELKQLKELRQKYIKERELIQIEIDRLVKEQEVLNYYLGSTLDKEHDQDWHSKPPMPTSEIQSIYKDYMDKYNNPNKEPEND